ncbi:hypothetical protein BKA70DRAFT_1500018 [Coprinopsis sp. MPI-PUGE-AT-0042]|nr:hypothetical protein BKA70DRAFT_1500018 [Coprinopsis sp. MPI-PUGE-AT-0042]
MLPLDAIEEIIKTLAMGGYLGELQQCALVNKSLAPLCQKQLYRKVHLTQPRDWSLPCNNTNLVDPIDQFREHLHNYPHLAAYVRELEMMCADDKDKKIDFMLLNQLNQVRKFTLGFPGFNRQAASSKGRSWVEFSNETRLQILSFLQQNPISSLSLVCISDIPLSLFNSCSQALKLEDLEIDQCLPAFGERFILSSPPAIDISRAFRLRVVSNKNEEDAALRKILACSNNLKVLDLSLERMFDDWTCAGDILSRLPPSSAATLKRFELVIGTYAQAYGGPPQFQLPPMGGIIEELARISGSNVVEEIVLTMDVSHETALPLDPEKYQELDKVLSTGFPKLRILRVSIIKVFCDHPEDPWQGAADFEEECGAFFKEHFGWCRNNLDFLVEIEGVVI